MIIDNDNLGTLEKAYSTAFNKGFLRIKSFYEKAAMVTTSSTGENTYAWLGSFPKIREWIGDRVVNNLTTRGYTIVNRLFESTVAVPRTKIEDDQYGVYTPLMDEMGRDAAAFPNELVAELLVRGHLEPCYDGQNFFDDEHPVLDVDGDVTLQSNYKPGVAPRWYLLDGSRAIGALIYQKRLDFEFAALTDKADERVFWKDEYVYGLRGRSSAGYGLWQLAYASGEELTPETYGAARSAMTTRRGDHARKLGIEPTLLLVPSELEEAARKLVNGATLANGESNPWKDTVELVVSAWLSE